MDAAEETTGEDDTLTKPEAEGIEGVHDGGWGWLVLVGCFTFNFISDGCAYSFGVLYTELLAYFEETKSKTAWIGSLFFSVPLLCGPIASVIISRVGCRKATIAGGVIAFLGFLCSSFVQSIEGLYLTYGIIAGFGISLPYLTSILVISQYFKKRLAFATGISECGGGVGTIVFAPLTEALLTAYGWRGTMYILAGITGNIIVCGAVFRPIPGRRRRTQKVSSRSLDPQMMEVCASKSSGDDTDSTHSTCHDNDVVQTNHTIKETDVSLETDVLYTSTKQNRDKVKTTTTSSRQHSNCCVCGTHCHKHCSRLNTSLKLSLFKHPIFILFIISNFILYFWFDVPFVFLSNRAVELNMSESRAALLVSVIGVLHTIGNLLFGLAGDVRRMSLPVLYGVAIAVCGVSLLAVPSFFSFLSLSMLAGLFGFFSAASEALSSILLIDILGEENLSQSYGFTMLLKGVANLVGPPVAGWLFDVSGNYDNTFYAAGACLMIAGLMYIPTPGLKRCRCSRARCKRPENQLDRVVEVYVSSP